MYAIASLLVVVALSLLITRVATAVLVATGMSGESARFQARSALTGAGFTTTESEAIVEHPLRRRVVMTLMLLGNVGIVASASSLIIGFKGGGPGASWVRLIELAAGMVVLVYLSRSRWVTRRLTALIRKLLHRYTDLPARDHATLLDLGAGQAVSEMAVQEGDWAAGRTLAELRLDAEGVMVLSLSRTGQEPVGWPGGGTLVRAGDGLVLCGDLDTIAELDARPSGPEGDAAHRASCERYDAQRAGQGPGDEPVRR